MKNGATLYHHSKSHAEINNQSQALRVHSNEWRIQPQCHPSSFTRKKVIAHKKLSVRDSWETHGQCGWYLVSSIDFAGATYAELNPLAESTTLKLSSFPCTTIHSL